MPTSALPLDELLAAAEAVAKGAYAPYSRFLVGAALLTEDGTVVAGCNVENVSYGLTICAERNAVFAAVAQGHTRFQAIAIVQGNADGPAPAQPGGRPCTALGPEPAAGPVGTRVRAWARAPGAQPAQLAGPLLSVGHAGRRGGGHTHPTPGPAAASG